MLHNSCNTGTRGLPDMSTLSPRACGPRASGVHIRQTTRACVTTVTCTPAKVNVNLIRCKPNSDYEFGAISELKFY